jgi:hypothetical protein
VIVERGAGGGRTRERRLQGALPGSDPQAAAGTAAKEGALMSALALEPRDAGVLDHEELDVDFEMELMELLHGPQACVNTCKRTVCSVFPCCPSIV